MLAPPSGIEQTDVAGDGGPAVRYTASVLEELRRLTVDGVNACSHGGLESGGVLFGLREPGCITVLAQAEAGCEHASGPRFILSEQDGEAFAGLQPPPGLETVGWFRAHTRGGADLDAHDRRMFTEYFDGTESVALILLPTPLGRATAAFFVRDASGKISPESPRLFDLEPVRQPGRETIPAPTAEVPPAREAIRGEAAPQVRNTRGKARWPWVAAMVAVAVLVALAIVYFRAGPSRLALQAYALPSGQVRIGWDRHSPAVLAAPSGVLEIQDGETATSIPMDEERLRSSSVVYAYRTSHVIVRLTVKSGKEGTPATEDRVELWGLTPEPAGTAEPSAGATEALADDLPPAASWRLEKAVEAVRKPEVEEPAPVPAVRKPLRSLPALPRPVTATAAPPLVLPAPPTAGFSAPASPVLTGALFAPPAGHPPAPAPAPAPSIAARTGRLIWTGLLGKRGVVEIDGAGTSAGSLTGALPGVPLTFRAMPAEFDQGGLVVYTADRTKNGVREAAAARNGWNATRFRVDEARAGELVVLEAPNRTNNFARLVLRNEGREWSVVIVEWSAAPR